MKREPELMDCDDEAAQLLPWFINGTLSNADAQRVAAHLERCETCRIDAAGQGHVQDLLRAPAQVEYSPKAGLRKLLTRIDGAEREMPAARPAPAASTPGWRAAGNSVRWLAAAVVVQAVALGAIAGVQFLGQPSGDEAAPYRTLTSGTLNPARAESASLRVVFVPTTTLAELQELLRANQLVAVAGPSDAGIFTLGLRSAASPEAQAAVLARLRADPRVRFAEPLTPEAAR
jgi:predicted anti-sigma-YlaC factor YlaD